MENQIKESQNTNEGNLSVSQQSINYLNETSPWLKFISIIGFVFSGLTFFSSFFILGASNYGYKLDIFSSILLFIIYVAIAIIIYIPNKYLYNYSIKIRDLSTLSSNNDLEEALYIQKKFWKFLGVVSIVYLASLVIIIPFTLGYISNM